MQLLAIAAILLAGAAAFTGSALAAELRVSEDPGEPQAALNFPFQHSLSISPMTIKIDLPSRFDDRDVR